MLLVRLRTILEFFKYSRRTGTGFFSVFSFTRQLVPCFFSAPRTACWRAPPCVPCSPMHRWSHPDRRLLTRTPHRQSLVFSFVYQSICPRYSMPTTDEHVYVCVCMYTQPDVYVLASLSLFFPALALSLSVCTNSTLARVLVQPRCIYLRSVQQHGMAHPFRSVSLSEASSQDRLLPTATGGNVGSFFWRPAGFA